MYLMDSNVPSMDWSGILRAWAIIQVGSDVDYRTSLIAEGVIVSHDQSSDAVPWAHSPGAAKTHLLRILIELHRREHRAQIQLGDVVEHSQCQHKECQADD